MNDYLRDNLNGTYTYLPVDDEPVVIEAANLQAVCDELFNLLDVVVIPMETEDIDLYALSVK